MSDEVRDLHNTKCEVNDTVVLRDTLEEYTITHINTYTENVFLKLSNGKSAAEFLYSFEEFKQQFVRAITYCSHEVTIYDTGFPASRKEWYCSKCGETLSQFS